MSLASLSSSYLCMLTPDGLLSWVHYNYLHQKLYFFSKYGFHGIMFGPLLLWGFSVVVKGLVLCVSVCVCCLYLCGVYPHSSDPVENEACYRAPCGAPQPVVTVWKSAVHEQEKKSKLCYFCKLLVLKLGFCVRLQLLRMYFIVCFLSKV